MDASEIRELSAFVAIVESGNFTRAAKRLGVTTSALSQTIRNLEERLGVRVLNRTTRSVAMTQAGSRVFEHVKPALGALAGVTEIANGFRDQPRGSLRVSCPRFYASMVLTPIIADFLRAYPDIVLELDTNDNFVDIIKGGFDAGIRLGENLARDMTAMKIGPEQRMAAVASPGYVAERGMPRTPRELREHRCINWRQPSSGSLYRWELEKNGRETLVEVSGPLIVADSEILMRGARAGLGIAFLLESMVASELASGTLLRMLEDWCPPFPGFYIYYPSRKHVPAALKAFVDFVRDALQPRARLTRR
jgi:DNA-binding transcriptional LysR family regulator